MIKVIRLYNYQLNILFRVYNIFYIGLLRPVTDDLLPLQQTMDYQPLEKLVKEKQEYKVKKILQQKEKEKRLCYLVKQIGYQKPTQKPAKDFKETAALEAFKKRQKEEGGIIRG